MNVDVANLLRKSTSRAKSDVANKLVSMLLHEVSRRLCQRLGMSVNRGAYPILVAEYFGNLCPYCGRGLIHRNLAVEHLDGMNRLRAGLHIPGNVIVACHDCNHEKRRDDQSTTLKTSSGWRAFLDHTSGECAQNCKSCEYWKSRFPETSACLAHLQQSAESIQAFRDLPEIRPFTRAAEEFRTIHGARIVELYRQGQDFAADVIREVADAITHTDP